MRQFILLSSLLAVLLAVTACHSGPTQSAMPQPAATPEPSQSPSPPTAMTQASSRSQPHPPVVAKSNPQVAQLDLDNEGGTRDGSYAMWVHVSEAGKPVPKLRVIAYNSENRVAATARTNEDGDARLLVQIANYRIAATHGKNHVEQTVAYHPGNQFELQLARQP